MEGEQLDEFVLAYLRKKGFKLAAKGLEEDLQQNNSSSHKSIDFQNDPELSKFFRSFSKSEDDPGRYQDGYSKLRAWTYGLLDLYKHELLRVLYPVFVHCFMDLVAKGHLQEARNFFNNFREDHNMMHLRDLQKLEGVLSPHHLEEMEFARTLRQSKVNIKICQYSYELLLQFLHRTHSILMLGTINERINFQVSPGQPSSLSDDAEAITLTGGCQDAATQINQKEVHWGLLEDSIEDRLDKAGGLLSDSEKPDGENKEGDLDESKKRPVESGKQGTSTKKLKKDKAANATAKAVRQDANTQSMAPRVKPELTLPIISTEVEQSILEDLRNRVQLSSIALPSISFYTFINTHNGLNCSSISHDGSLVAGGFADSSLKVWDMAKLGQKAYSSVLQGENDSTNEHVIGPSGGKRSYTLFQGHSGPVYSATFSPLGDFVLSSSADTTIRLWSTKLNANLVCYKGHNYPVWDVQFSPVGHYFASCSHDRTARIWSMDRIQPLRIMAGHLSDVDLASGSADCTVKLWDVTTSSKVSKTEEKSGNPNRLRLLKTLPTKSTPVYSLRFSRRNLLFAAGAFSKNT
ncbi:transcription initiation factor TFIID subunit 5 [Carica papaya]|uniref:transcription initiation factor TFIID subunit 5 n=1 Tax=Carica papaya TaxID=3649 RepID=UPI000B8D18C8|nr:transcription initiation factor TFIID subunit 5 [Carica papaya]